MNGPAQSRKRLREPAIAFVSPAKTLGPLRSRPSLLADPPRAHARKNVSTSGLSTLCSSPCPRRRAILIRLVDQIKACATLPSCGSPALASRPRGLKPASIRSPRRRRRGRCDTPSRATSSGSRSGPWAFWCAARTYTIHSWRTDNAAHIQRLSSG